MTELPWIRPARAEDTAALAALAERTFRQTFEAVNDPADMEAYLGRAFSPEQIRAELEDEASTFLLAFADGAAPSGYAKLREGEPDPSVRGPEAVEIERLYVEHSAIGKGLGAALMRDCLARAAAAGFRTVWLGVWEHNLRAIGFYERWGFERIGSHVFLLGSDEQTDLIFERPLDTT